MAANVSPHIFLPIIVTVSAMESFKVIDIWRAEVYLTQNMIIIIIVQLKNISIGPNTDLNKNHK